MKVFCILAGTRNVKGGVIYSITSERQINSLNKLGVNIKLGFVFNRTSPIKIISDIKKLKKQIIDFKPDLIHSHYGSVVSYVAYKAANKNYPLVISYCGDDLIETKNNNILWKIRSIIGIALSKMTSNYAQRIITKSSNLFDELNNNVKSKINVIPNGVDSALFRPLKSRSDLRKKFGFSADQHVVLFNQGKGSNKSVKNISLAKQTIYLLNEMGINVILFKISDYNENKLIQLMNACDCLLLTSLHEGSPNIVKEAMACNLPIVSVNCGDVRKRLSNVNIGGIYKYLSNDLALGLQNIFNSKLEFNGRDQFKIQNLDSKSIAKIILNEYEMAIMSFKN